MTSAKDSTAPCETAPLTVGAVASWAAPTRQSHPWNPKTVAPAIAARATQIDRFTFMLILFKVKWG
jgi:hypothetical protein